MTLMERIASKLAATARNHWCAFTRGGRACNHPAATYLVPLDEDGLGAWACEHHARSLVAIGSYRDPR